LKVNSKAMAYPRRAVRKGDPRVDVVMSVQARLEEVGCGPLEADGIFGADTESSVKLFQTRRSLLADGVVGPLTWTELFAEPPQRFDEAPPGLLAGALVAALSQEGVRETQRNRGAEVDRYISRVGLNPAGGYSWCQAFVYWSFDEAAINTKIKNPCIKTAGVLDHWARSPTAARVYAEQAFDDPTLIRPGAIFIVDHGGGKGHTGIVTKIVDGEIGTIEGNTNQRGSREGDGVYQKVRTIGSINVGFVDYGR
jgi:peptidoglycan hydrolase-like protein with peptidoglycan-binding domain